MHCLTSLLRALKSKSPPVSLCGSGDAAAQENWAELISGIRGASGLRLLFPSNLWMLQFTLAVVHQQERRVHGPPHSLVKQRIMSFVTSAAAVKSGSSSRAMYGGKANHKCNLICAGKLAQYQEKRRAAFPLKTNFKQRLWRSGRVIPESG